MRYFVHGRHGKMMGEGGRGDKSGDSGELLVAPQRNEPYFPFWIRLVSTSS